MSLDRKTNRVYLVLVSEKEPEQNLARALELLAKSGGIAAVSKAYVRPTSSPSDRGPVFLGVLFESPMDAPDLKRWNLSPMERTLNKEVGEKTGGPEIPLNQSLRIEMVFFNHEFVEMGKSEIPHPKVVEDGALAIPLAEIDPGYRHPLTGEQLKTIADRLSEKSAVVECSDLSFANPDG